MRTRRANFLSDTEFEIGQLRFLYGSTDYSTKSTADLIVLLKTPEFIHYYEDLFEAEPIVNVLEIGVFQGGMAVLLPLMKDDIRYLGMDLTHELPVITEILATHPDIGGRSTILEKFPQGDPRTQETIDSHFDGEELDLVMDDASHMYAFTKKTFEMVFPKLREGGRYIIEDWSWMHWPGYSPPPEWLEEPALSNLLMEISIACAGDHGLISKIEVFPSMFVVHKGARKIPAGWKLEDSMTVNGAEYRHAVMAPTAAAFENTKAMESTPPTQSIQ